MPSLNHCDLLRHVGVNNNLPKVVTRQRRGRELNSQPASCKSNALATRLPSHPVPSGILIHPSVWPQQTWAEKCGCCTLSMGRLGSPSNTMSPVTRPTSAPSGILIHRSVWPQYANITDRQERQRSHSTERTVSQTVVQNGSLAYGS